MRSRGNVYTCGKVGVSLLQKSGCKLTLGSRPPFPGQLICVGSLETNVKLRQSLLTVDNSEEDSVLLVSCSKTEKATILTIKESL